MHLGLDSLGHRVLAVGLSAQGPLAGAAVRYLAGKPALQVHRLEHLTLSHHRFGPAEEEESAVVEREVKSGEDLRLRLRVEVHQGVTADEQIDPRDRGVTDQVMTAEDDLPPQILPEDVRAIHLLEVALQQPGRYSLDLTRGVRGVTCGVERLLVDVGRVNLDSLPEVLLAHGLRQEHRDGVGFLSRRAAGAPRSHQGARRLAAEDLRHDQGAYDVPGLWIAKEAGDVDQNGGEQSPEFIGMHLQVVLVGAVALQPKRVHPFPDPSRESGRLVAVEVEPPGHLQEPQQAGPLLVVRAGGHLLAGSRGHLLGDVVLVDHRIQAELDLGAPTSATAGL